MKERKSMQHNLLSHVTLSLKNLEETIETGIKGYIKAGMALEAIKSGKLYKGAYGTYEAYCRERWNFTPQYSNRLIAAAKIVNKMKISETTGSVIPQSENQVRALSQVADPISAWMETQEATGKEQPTAKEIREVIQKDEDDVIDVEVDCTVSDPKDVFWVRFAHLLDHPYEFGDTSGRKQIGIDTDDGTVDRLEELKNMTGYTKGAIVSQALCLLEEMIALKNGESSSRK